MPYQFPAYDMLIALMSSNSTTPASAFTKLAESINSLADPPSELPIMSWTITKCSFSAASEMKYMDDVSTSSSPVLDAYAFGKPYLQPRTVPYGSIATSFNVGISDWW